MKLDIFYPEDFISTKDRVVTSDRESHEVLKDWQRDFAAKTANAKLNEWLEKNAKKVIGNPEIFIWDKPPQRVPTDTHQALLVCIEPIESCKHPKEKVSSKILIPDGWRGDFKDPMYSTWFACECGVIVQPKDFEEVK